MSLADNVHVMTNKELNGLAQNRFIDSDTQMEIARHPYRRAREYLAENPSITTAVRDVLWGHRGYVLKTLLIQTGKYRDEIERYRELYETARSRWGKASWRMGYTFISGYWGHSCQGAQFTPSDLLNDIYDDFVGREDHGYVQYYKSYQLKGLANHPNCDIKLAIKLSQHSDAETQKLGFSRLVALQKT